MSYSCCLSHMCFGSRGSQASNDCLQLSAASVPNNVLNHEERGERLGLGLAGLGADRGGVGNLPFES